VEKRIKKFGSYVVNAETAAGSIAGSITVAADNCTGPPPLFSDDERASIVAAMGQFAQARRTADGPALFGSLHSTVIAHYGEAACRDFYATQIGADPTFAFGPDPAISGPEPYTYVTGGVTIGTVDAFKVIVDTTMQGQTQAFTWHVDIEGSPGEDRVTWFQPCAR
jgi:hypothetical protein